MFPWRWSELRFCSCVSLKRFACRSLGFGCRQFSPTCELGFQVGLLAALRALLVHALAERHARSDWSHMCVSRLACLGCSLRTRTSTRTRARAHAHTRTRALAHTRTRAHGHFACRCPEVGLELLHDALLRRRTRSDGGGSNLGVLTIWAGAEVGLGILARIVSPNSSQAYFLCWIVSGSTLASLPAWRERSRASRAHPAALDSVSF